MSRLVLATVTQLRVADTDAAFLGDPAHDPRTAAVGVRLDVLPDELFDVEAFS